MKTFKIITLSIASYVIMCMFLLGIYACDKLHSSPVKEEKDIPTRISREKFESILSKRDNSSFNYMRVNKQQLKAMNLILEENQGVKGFKLYLVDSLILVTGYDSLGDVIIPKFSTEIQGSGPCPTYCDEPFDTIQQ